MPRMYTTSISKQLVVVGKWVLGLNVGGLAITFALIVSSYLLIPQTNSCQAIYFISSAIVGSSRLAWFFAVGAGLAITGVVIPGLVGVCRNIYRFAKRRTLNNLAPIDIDDEFSGYSETVIYGFVFYQLMAVALGATIFFIMFVVTLNMSLEMSPKTLFEDWNRLSESKCDR